MKKSVFLFVLLFVVCQAYAKVQIASVFSDDMVLQANQTITVWGTACIAESVTVVPPKRWAKFRLGQEKCLQHPFTGMVTAMDIGNKEDIHPKNKQEVGRRLALCALNQTYGKNDVICQGPVLNSIVKKGKNLLLTFDHCEGGLKNKDKEKFVQGFSAVLANGEEVELSGKIISENTIKIKASNVKRIRYAYANYPVCPLYNGEGLPALSFDKEIIE